MTSIRARLRQAPWLLDDAITPPLSNGPLLDGGIQSPEAAPNSISVLSLPLDLETRRLLGTLMVGRFGEVNFVNTSLILEGSKDPIVEEVRTTGMLWFTEYLGAIINKRRENKAREKPRELFTSRELIELGFPVGGYSDSYAPVEKVLRKFREIDILTKRRLGPYQSQYEITPRLKSIKLEYSGLLEPYEFGL